MADMNGISFYRTVKPSVEGAKDMPFSIEQLKRQQYAAEQMQAVYDHNRKVEDDFNRKQKEIAAMESISYRGNLQLRKNAMMDDVCKKFADNIVSEAFCEIYLKALPHDPEFVAENYSGLKQMGHMYIRKLGGMDYLRKRAMESNIPWIKKFYVACESVAKKGKKKRIKDIADAISEQEAMDALNFKMDNEEHEEMLKNIDKLGADQLSELIKYKVINVVRDENNREKEQREMRSVLKTDLEDDSVIDTGDSTTDFKNLDKSDAVDAPKIDEGDEAPDNAKETGKMEMKNELKDEKGENTSLDNPTAAHAMEKKAQAQSHKTASHPAVQESFYWDNRDDLKKVMESWDPIHGNFLAKEAYHPTSLLFAMTVSVARDMMKHRLGAAMEGTAMRSSSGMAGVTSPNSPIDNALNLDVFTTFMNDRIDSVRDTNIADQISSPALINGTVDKIDKNSILVESLLQYTLLETAHTMKLIDVTPQMVSEQVNYLLNH